MNGVYIKELTPVEGLMVWGSNPHSQKGPHLLHIPQNREGQRSTQLLAGGGRGEQEEPGLSGAVRPSVFAPREWDRQAFSWALMGGERARSAARCCHHLNVLRDLGKRHPFLSLPLSVPLSFLPTPPSLPFSPSPLSHPLQ